MKNIQNLIDIAKEKFKDKSIKDKKSLQNDYYSLMILKKDGLDLNKLSKWVKGEANKQKYYDSCKKRAEELVIEGLLTNQNGVFTFTDKKSELLLKDIAKRFN